MIWWTHSQVSSIRESKSDDKRFSIFTGTKRLHLRAESREDRYAWVEALQAVKDMFPRISNSELMAPVDNVAVSTEKLRQRLVEEGVRDAAIQDSEQIMRTEFAALQSQLLLLKQKQWLLIDTLRQLEVWKPYAHWNSESSSLVSYHAEILFFLLKPPSKLLGGCWRSVFQLCGVVICCDSFVQNGR